MIKKFSKEAQFDCGIHEVAPGKVKALTAVVTSKGMGLGLAIANKPGYIAIPLNACNGDNWDELQAHAEELNMELYGLNEHAADLIVFSTMGRSPCK